MVPGPLAEGKTPMSILTAFAVGACLGVWLDIAIQRWGDTLLASHVGCLLTPVFFYLRDGMTAAWDLLRFEIPDLIRRQIASR